MKNRVVLVFVLALTMCSFGYGQTAASILGMETKTSKSDLEAEALEYFQAVVDGDADTIVKYVHPKVVEELGSKGVVLEILKVELKAMQEEGFEPISITLLGSAPAKDGQTPLSAIISHNVVVRTADGEFEFPGKLNVYTTSGKNYFIYLEHMILQSLGIEELEDAEEEEAEESSLDPKPIERGILNGTAKSLPVPKYPIAARLAKVTGEVKVQVIIDKNGKVISAKAISGDRLLIPAAEKAASEAIFTPTKLSGQAVIVSGIIIYNFNP